MDLFTINILFHFTEYQPHSLTKHLILRMSIEGMSISINTNSSQREPSVGLTAEVPSLLKSDSSNKGTPMSICSLN